MSSYHHIILLGPPASGKGTQGKRLSKFLSLPILGTGNILRQAIEDNTDLGKEASQYLDEGLYVPDTLIESLVEDWTSHHQHGWIFDGFPRTQGQAEFIHDNAHIHAPDLVVGFDVPVEELERRINSRRQCKKCDTVTSTFVHQGLNCPDQDCDGMLYARNDDAIESFRTRYTQYQKFTAPLFEYYMAKGNLIQVNGAQNPQLVFDEVKVAVTERLKSAI